MYLNPLAIFAGLFVDLFLSIFFTALALSIYGGVAGAQGDVEKVLADVVATPSAHASLAVLLIVAGAMADGIAGYLAGRLGRRLELWHALVLMGLLLVVHYAIRRDGEVMSWLEWLSLAVGVVAMFKGAAIAKQQRLRRLNRRNGE